MVGREAERARVEQTLDRISRGAVGLCLEGAPGIGKSTVWREAVALAGERGVRVIATVPSEADRGMAFSGLGDLLGDVPEGLFESLPARQRRAVTAALLIEDPEPEGGPEALPRAVLGTLRGLAAADSPVLIVGGLAVVLAGLDVWTGQASSAHERLQPLRDSLSVASLGFLGEVTLGMWTVDIEALIACGRVGEAEAVAVELLGRARAGANPNAVAIAERCRGLVLAAGGETGEAIEAMQRALAAHDRRPVAPEIARTLLELGALRRRAKQKKAAKQSLDRALEMFTAIGAPMWEERARDELARVGLRRAVVTEGLTPAQQRVAELVAAGMSNREIAATLYMSVRSFEAHLTKAYRELGVRSRSQLVAVLAANNDAGGPDSSPLTTEPT